MAPKFRLNDLFVVPSARRGGAGSALLHAAAEYERGAGAVQLVLSAEVVNTTAQSLYEMRGPAGRGIRRFTSTSRPSEPL